MTKNKFKKKNHALHKELCGLVCLKKIELQKNNDKGKNVNNNSTKIQSTYILNTMRINLWIYNNFKYFKERINRSQF